MFEDIESFLEELNNKSINGEYDLLLSSFTEAKNKVERHISGDKDLLYELIEMNRGSLPEDLKIHRSNIGGKPTTDFFTRFLDYIYQIFNNKSFLIENDESLQIKINELEEKGFFGFNSLKTLSTFEDYFFNIVSSRTFSDPNAFISFVPDIDLGVISSTQEVNLIPKLIGSDKIESLGSNYVMYLSGIESDGLGNDIYKYDLVTETSYYRIIKYKNKFTLLFGESESLGEVLETYVHDLGYVPIVFLGGYVKFVNINSQDYCYYISFCDSAADAADEYYMAVNDHRVIQRNTGHPIRVADEVECNLCSGHGYDLTKDSDDDVTKVKCKKCRGSGILPSLTADGIFYRKKSSLRNEGSSDVPFQYIVPPVDGIKSHSEYTFGITQSNLAKALRGGFIEEAQSGIAKEIDRENKKTLLTRISKNIQRVILTSLNIISDYYELPKNSVVIAPTNFKVKTEFELKEEFESLKRSDAPFTILYPVYLDFLSKRFKNDLKSKKLSKFIPLYDSLFFTNLKPDELDNQVLSGIISKEDLIKHKMSERVFLQFLLNKSNSDLFESEEFTYEIFEKTLDKLLEKYLKEVSQPNINTV